MLTRKRFIPVVALGLFFLASFAFVSANADQQPTLIEGSNFDRIDYQNGTKIDTIYSFNRVYDFTDAQGKDHFTSYKLSEGPTWITYESEYNTFTFDKSTCSLKHYDAGRLDGNLLIPSHSLTVKGKALNATNWSNVNVINNASCSVNLQSNSTHVTITGTKSVANVGSFTQIWTQETYGLLKATWQVTNNNPSWTNHQVGFTETLNVPQFVKLGNTTYNLANYNGTVLGKTWIENNQAKLIQLADRIHYDFGLGFNELSDIKIEWDGSQARLNFNYLDVGQVNVGQTVTVDPTYGPTDAVWVRVFTSAASGTCGTPSEIDSAAYHYELPVSAGSSICYITTLRFNIQSIPTVSAVSDVDFTYDVTAIGTPYNCDYTEITSDPIGRTPQSLWDDALSTGTDAGGVEYVSNDAGCTTVANNKLLDLGTTADATAKTRINSGGGYFALGQVPTSIARDASVHTVTFSNPRLTIVYTTATEPSQATLPVGLGGENSVTLKWGTSQFDGDTALTGYRIDRRTTNPLFDEPLADFRSKDYLKLSGLIGYWKFDNDLLDSSQYAHHGTITGIQTFTTGQRNEALSLSGSSNYVTIPNDRYFDFDRTQPFSVAFWMKTSTAGSWQSILDKSSVGLTGGTGYGIYLDTTNKMNFDFGATTTSWVRVNTVESTSFTNGKWQHVVITYDGNGLANGVNVYLNGTSITTATLANTSTTPILNDNEVRIGVTTSTTFPYTGQLDEVQVWSKLLSQSEITEIYSSSNPINYNAVVSQFVNMTGNTLLLHLEDRPIPALMKFENDLLDSGGQSNHGTASGTAAFTTGKIGQGFSAGGSNSVTLANEENFDFERTDPFSVSFWMKGTSQDVKVLVSKGTINSATSWAIWVRTPNAIHVTLTNTDTTNEIEVRNTVLTTLFDNNWHHVTVTYDGSSTGTGVKLYFDGVDKALSVEQNSLSGTILNNNVVGIAGDQAGGTRFTGTIDEVQIVRKVLSYADVQRLYNSGNGLNIPSLPFVDSSGVTTVGAGGGDAGYFGDDVFTHGWTEVGTLVTANDQSFQRVIKFNAALDGTDRRVHKSLGFTLDDNRFKMQAKFVPTAGTTVNHLPFVLQAGTGDPDTATQDAIGINYFDSTGFKLRTYYKDGSATETYSSGTITAPAGATNVYYLTLERTSSTEIKLSAFSDPARLTHVTGSPITQTIPATVTALTTFQSSVLSSGVGTNSLTALIDDIYIGKITTSNFQQTDMQRVGIINDGILFDGKNDYLNITSSLVDIQDFDNWSFGFWYSPYSVNTFSPLSYKKTSTQATAFGVNQTHLSLFTDNYIPVFQNARTTTTPTYSTSFETQAGWTSHGSCGAVDPIDLRFEMSCGTSQGGIYRVLSSALSDTTWSATATFSVHDLATNQPNLSPMVFVMSATTAYPASGADDKIGVGVVDQDFPIVIRTGYSDGASGFTFGTGINIGYDLDSSLSGNIKYYIKQERTSATNVKLSVFSDPEMTTHVSGSPVNTTIPSTIQSLDTVHLANLAGQTGASSITMVDDLTVNADAVQAHVVFTRSGNDFKTYLNGVQVGTTVTSSTNLGTPLISYLIGANATKSDLYFNGIMDEFFVMNRTLTDTEISNIYTRGTGTYSVLTTVGMGNCTTTSCSYTDSGLSDATNYFYRILGVNEVGTGQYTNYIRSQTYGVAGAPTSLTASRASSSQIDVSLTPPVTNGGPTIVGYYLKRQNITNYIEQPFIEGELSHFKFDDDQRKDTGTLANNFALSAGTSTFETGMIYRATVFDGSTYYLVPDETDYDFERTTPFSISVWLKTSTLTNHIIIAKGMTTDYSTDGWDLMLNSAGEPLFALANPAGTQKLWVKDATNYANGKWQHLVVTYDGSSTPSGVKFYHNGTLQSTTTLTNTLASSIQNNKQVTLGAGDGGFAKFTGSLDDLRLYNKVVPATEVTKLFNYRLLTSTSFSDTGLAPRTTYNYRATTMNQIGESAVSNTGTATTIDSPTAPPTLVATAITSTRIDLSWTIPSNDGGSPIIGYRIERNSTAPDSMAILVNNTGNTNLTYTDNTVTGAHTQKYRVAAWNAYGLGAYSPNATATTLEGTVGNHYINATVVGDVAGIQSRIQITNGIPSPSVTQLQLFNSTTLLETKTITGVTIVKGNTQYIPFTFYKVMTSPSTFSVKATVTNVTGTVILTSNSTVLSPTFTWSGVDLKGDPLNYTFTHTPDFTQRTLSVLRTPINFQLECLYQPASNFEGGKFWINATDVGYYKKTVNVADSETLYATCYNDEHLFTAVSYGTSLGTVKGVLSGIENQVGDFFGAPLPIAILLLVGAMWTGRTAATGIIFVLAAIGILGGMGLVTVQQWQWGLVMFMGTIGLLMGTIFRE